MFKVCKITNEARIPTKNSQHAAGYDIYCHHDVVLPAKNKTMIPTGLIMEIPEGYYGKLESRSSVAWNGHTSIGAGVIDSDYRGEVKVIIFNHSDQDYHIKSGDRIAQLIILKHENFVVTEVDDTGILTNTSRGSGGFGSTGR